MTGVGLILQLEAAGWYVNPYPWPGGGAPERGDWRSVKRSSGQQALQKTGPPTAREPGAGEGFRKNGWSASRARPAVIRWPGLGLRPDPLRFDRRQGTGWLGHGEQVQRQGEAGCVRRLRDTPLHPPPCFIRGKTGIPSSLPWRCAGPCSRYGRFAGVGPAGAVKEPRALQRRSAVGRSGTPGASVSLRLPAGRRSREAVAARAAAGGHVVDVVLVDGEDLAGLGPAFPVHAAQLVRCQ